MVCLMRFLCFGKDSNLPEAIINCFVKTLRGYCLANTDNVSTVFSNFIAAELLILIPCLQLNIKIKPGQGMSQILLKCIGTEILF